MYARFGVLGIFPKSPASASRPTTFIAQLGSSITEWKYTKGSWRVAYMSPLRAINVGSPAPIAGCRHVFGSPAALPMSSWYAFHVRPWASSWLAIVRTDFGYAQPWPSAWPYAPVPVETNSVNVGQSACVW